MSATVVPLPPNNASETTDFLRRMASMVSGRNGEMLLRAAAMIDSLTHRAMSAEQLFHRQQEESTRNAELREVAELASDGLLRQIDALRAQLAGVTEQAAAEREQFEAEQARFETERARFEAERERLAGVMQDAEAHVAGVEAELETLKKSVDEFNATAVSVPIEVLRLARAQFDFLSDGFAKNGDLISRAMSEIGGCAIDQVLATKAEKSA
jgi:chromosome segregation ATPase